MANSRVLLADLKAGRCSNVAEVRLLRFWEARNVRKGGEPMSVDMLFVDENVRIMPIGWLRFRDRLSEGSLYTLTGFDVTRSNTNFRLSDAPFSIRFNEGTELDKIPASVRPIPTELFRFMPCSQILELANTGKQLPDIIGRLFLNGHGADPGSSTSKVEPMTISELNKFITTADSQIIEFLCTAEVTGIQLDDDHTDSASFLSFDMEMAKLTNIQTSEAAQIVGIGVDAQVDTELPQSLADIVGKTYTFQLKLKDFNFSSKHQTFTISRIFPERLLAPMPAFVVAVYVPDVAPPEIVAQPPNANVGTTSTGADSPASSDASAAKRPPTAKDEDDVDKTSPKKAHVE
ncbi:hypothetical protein YC2023_083561 [Brassica napus]